MTGSSWQARRVGTRTRRLCAPLAGAALSAALLAPAGAAAAASTEVEFAFDATGSMAASLDRSRAAAREMIASVTAADPEARFAVVQFRDHTNPGGNYELLQPMTGDRGAIESALARLRPVSTEGLIGNTPGSYSLVFRQAYADPALGWLPNTRKQLVVFGDAEPYGAGSAGLEGCTDTSADPANFDAATELQRLRDAQRALFMVHVPSGEATATPGCYASIAQRVNGAAAPTTAPLGTNVMPSNDAVTSVTELATGLSVRFRADKRSVPRGRRVGMTLTITNAGRGAMRLNRIVTTLPTGFTYQERTASGLTRTTPRRSGRRLSWKTSRRIAPRTTMKLRFTVKAGTGRGRKGLAAAASFTGARTFTVKALRTYIRVS
jgi:hypothetical protein